MNRRGFIGSILALSAAPAIVRAESLMKIGRIFAPQAKVWTMADLSDEQLAQLEGGWYFGVVVAA